MAGHHAGHDSIGLYDYVNPTPRRIYESTLGTFHILSHFRETGRDGSNIIIKPAVSEQ